MVGRLIYGGLSRVGLWSMCIRGALLLLMVGGVVGSMMRCSIVSFGMLSRTWPRTV